MGWPSHKHGWPVWINQCTSFVWWWGWWQSSSYIVKVRPYVLLKCGWWIQPASSNRRVVGKDFETTNTNGWPRLSGNKPRCRLHTRHTCYINNCSYSSRYVRWNLLLYYNQIFTNSRLTWGIEMCVAWHHTSALCFSLHGKVSNNHFLKEYKFIIQPFLVNNILYSQHKNKVWNQV